VRNSALYRSPWKERSTQSNRRPEVTTDNPVLTGLAISD
jgi:hypothetical protein